MTPDKALKKVILRAPEPSDVDIMYRWENDPSGWEAGDSLSPMSRNMLEKFVKDYDGDILSTRQLRMIVIDAMNAEAVGIVDIFDFDPINRRAAVGIVIEYNLRGQGYGHAAIEAIKGYCFSRLGLNQIYATIAADNNASRRIFSKSGFIEVAVLTQWLARGYRFNDAILYQCILSDLDNSYSHS